jgi:hypothetical protein
MGNTRGMFSGDVKIACLVVLFLLWHGILVAEHGQSELG